jgi:hypothetical protein
MSRRFTTTPAPRPTLTPARRRHIHGQLLGFGAGVELRRRADRASRLAGYGVAAFAIFYFGAQLARPIVAAWLS